MSDFDLKRWPELLRRAKGWNMRTKRDARERVELIEQATALLQEVARLRGLLVETCGQWELWMRAATYTGLSRQDAEARLGELLKEFSDRVLPDEEYRCAVCGWPLAASVEDGCVRGNCSLRPRPNRLYAPERAKAEETALGDSE